MGESPVNGGYEGAHNNWYPISLQGGCALSHGHDCHSVAGDQHHITGQADQRGIFTAAYCDKQGSHYLFFADRPLGSVTLVDGAQSWPYEALYAQTHSEGGLRDTLTACDRELLLARTYIPPLGARSCPDDSVVEFECASDEPTAGSR